MRWLPLSTPKPTRLQPARFMSCNSSRSVSPARIPWMVIQGTAFRPSSISMRQIGLGAIQVGGHRVVRHADLGGPQVAHQPAPLGDDVLGRARPPGPPGDRPWSSRCSVGAAARSDDGVGPRVRVAGRRSAAAGWCSVRCRSSVVGRQGQAVQVLAQRPVGCVDHVAVERRGRRCPGTCAQDSARRKVRPAAVQGRTVPGSATRATSTSMMRLSSPSPRTTRSTSGRSRLSSGMRVRCGPPRMVRAPAALPRPRPAQASSISGVVAGDADDVVTARRQAFGQVALLRPQHRKSAPRDRPAASPPPGSPGPRGCACARSTSRKSD